MKTWTKIEPEVGEVFEYIGKRVRCVEDNPYDANQCALCAFYGSLRCTTVYCAERERGDKRNVHFIKLQKP